MPQPLAPILDQIAQIAGGTTQTDIGRWTGAGIVGGSNTIVEAWSRVPDSVYQAFTFIVWPPHAAHFYSPHEEGGGPKFKIVNPYHLTARLFISRWGPSSEQNVNDLIPFYDSVFNTYAVNVTLNGVCQEAWIDDMRTVVFRFAGAAWLTLEAEFMVIVHDPTIIHTA